MKCTPGTDLLNNDRSTKCRMILSLFEPWPKQTTTCNSRVTLINGPPYKCITNLHLHSCLSSVFGFHPLQFLSMYGKKSSIPKGAFDIRTFSLKQMVEASESERQQGNTSGPRSKCSTGVSTIRLYISVMIEKEREAFWKQICHMGLFWIFMMTLQ